MKLAEVQAKVTTRGCDDDAEAFRAGLERAVVDEAAHRREPHRAVVQGLAGEMQRDPFRSKVPELAVEGAVPRDR